MSATSIFHLAIPIGDVKTAKDFYCDKLGRPAGRETEKALILDFWGHQVVAHVSNVPLIPQKGIYPRHFGLIFTESSYWDELRAKIEENNLKFYLEPKARFPGEVTEHRTFFIEDPFYNLLEFKHYSHAEAIFGSLEMTAIGDRSD